MLAETINMNLPIWNSGSLVGGFRQQKHASWHLLQTIFEIYEWMECSGFIRLHSKQPVEMFDMKQHSETSTVIFRTDTLKFNTFCHRSLCSIIDALINATEARTIHHVNLALASILSQINIYHQTFQVPKMEVPTYISCM